jgi:hypothetical protein
MRFVPAEISGDMFIWYIAGFHTTANTPPSLMEEADQLTTTVSAVSTFLKDAFDGRRPAGMVSRNRLQAPANGSSELMRG